MFRGIEIAASGMSSIINLNDIIANNLANVNTPGFKQLIPSFKNIHETVISADTNSYANWEKQNSPIGSLSLGSMLDATQLDFNQGAFKKTDNPLDIALNSDGFFAIQDKKGEECYTRNGSFSINEEGDLITRAGDLVLSENGRPINIDLAESSYKDITIMADGRIMVNNEEVDKLKVVNFEHPEKLISAGNTLFKNSDETNKPIEMENYTVMQGYIEGSNAGVVESMINSITGARTYETLARVITNTDSTLKKAVNEVGRVM